MFTKKGLAESPVFVCEKAAVTVTNTGKNA
jgi:hypothetical protein